MQRNWPPASRISLACEPGRRHWRVSRDVDIYVRRRGGRGAQAEKELGPDWTLQKADAPGVPNPPAWLAKNLPAGARVGVDPFLHTIHAARNLQQVRSMLQCRMPWQAYLILWRCLSVRKAELQHTPAKADSRCQAGATLANCVRVHHARSSVTANLLFVKSRSLGGAPEAPVGVQVLGEAGLSLVPVLGGNLVDAVWEGRPPASSVTPAHRLVAGTLT